VEKLLAFFGFVALAVLGFIGFKRSNGDLNHTGTQPATDLARDSKDENKRAASGAASIAKTSGDLAESIDRISGLADDAGSAVDDALGLIDKIRARAALDDRSDNSTSGGTAID
jgi:hypothetical protein